MLTGAASIEHLATKSLEHDAAASSHWQKYHSEFRYKDGVFHGLQGFGGNSSNPFAAPIHWALQHRYRKIGVQFSRFTNFKAQASQVAKAQGRILDQDLLRQALTLGFLDDHLRFPSPPIVAVIGDGFAAMTSLLLQTGWARHVVLVNLTKTLLVDLCYGAKTSGFDMIRLCMDPNDLRDLRPEDFPAGGVTAIEASQSELLALAPFDLAINIASMQEMNPEIIADYFSHMRAALPRTTPRYFYCCNREEKILPDGTRVRFADYPWRDDDEILIDELCPWHQFFYTKRPPFFRSYDGPTNHRLVSLAASQ